VPGSRLPFEKGFSLSLDPGTMVDRLQSLPEQSRHAFILKIMLALPQDSRVGSAPLDTKLKVN
jgi:hypothetical protein